MKFFNYEEVNKFLNCNEAEYQELELDESKFYIRKDVDEQPVKGSFYSTDITHRYFNKGWNIGHHYKTGYVLTPWELTSWGSKEDYEKATFVPEKPDYDMPIPVGTDVYNAFDGIGKSKYDALLRNAYMSKKELIVITCLGKYKFMVIASEYSSNYYDTMGEFASAQDLERAVNAYFEQKREAQEIALKARLEAEKEAEERAAKEQHELKEKKKEFARMCTRKARKHQIPFDIALAFKGDDESIQLFINSVKRVIDQKIPVEFKELYAGRDRNYREMRRLEIFVGNIDTNRINDYVAECLERGCIFKEW